MKLTLPAAALALVPQLTPTAAGAQQWSIDAQAGRVRAALDAATPSSETAVLGLRYDNLESGFRLSAGTPLSGSEYVWGTLSGWRRFAFRRAGFLAGLDAAGNAFLLHAYGESATLPPLPGPSAPQPPREGGHALAGQALPVIGYETSMLQLQLRAGASLYRSDMGTQVRERTVRLADAQLAYAPVPNVILTPVVRRFQARGEGRATFVGISTVLAHDRVTVWGSAGQWLDVELDEETAWGAGGSLKLHPRLSVVTSVRRDVYDPLYLSPAQTSWNLGLSLQVAGRVGGPRAPVPASYNNGIATVRLAASATRGAPSIAGDFNGWNPEPMRRVGDAWVYTVAVPPGVYNYAFVDESGSWFVPESVPGRKDDGMGGHVAVLVVR